MVNLKVLNCSQDVGQVSASLEGTPVQLRGQNTAPPLPVPVHYGRGRVTSKTGLQFQSERSPGPHSFSSDITARKSVTYPVALTSNKHVDFPNTLSCGIISKYKIKAACSLKAPRSYRHLPRLSCDVAGLRRFFITLRNCAFQHQK